MSRKNILKLIIGFCIIAVLFLIYFFSTPRSVDSFYTVHLGMDNPPQMQTEQENYDASIRVTGKEFYVYIAHKDVTWCSNGGCGMGGALVECMGGRFVSVIILPNDQEYGLSQNDVNAGKSIIVVSDRNQKIVGIYPNYTIQNIPYILKNHRNLSDKFDFCYDTQMPKRW